MRASRLATFKSLLIGTRWVEAGRSRKCYHNKKHSIVKGDRVLEVRVGIGWQGYCKNCAAEMIQMAAEELAAMGK